MRNRQNIFVGKGNRMMKLNQFATMAGLVAVLALGSIAQAGVDVVITQLASPAAGLDAYKVTAVGTGGFDVGSIASLNLDGSVHHVWVNAVGGMKSTIAGDLAGSAFGNAAWAALDTHLLIDPNAGHLLSPGFGVDENNGMLNDAGLPPLVPSNAAFAAFTGTAGLGDLFFTGVAPQITLNPFAASVDFLQVVVLSGQFPLLDVSFVDSSSSGFINYPDILIPEPATFGVLAAGGLLLLRRRRIA
jgi:hypothetical protein